MNQIAEFSLPPAASSFDADAAQDSGSYCTFSKAATSVASWPCVAEPPPLDIAQLHRRCMGRMELVDRLLASFEKRFPVELLEIEAALNPLDEPRLLHLVHRLKGAAANISAPLLHREIEQMEAAIRAGQGAIAEQFVSRLQAEWERFTQFKDSVCSP